jgi:hypothetical protein
MLCPTLLIDLNFSFHDFIEVAVEARGCEVTGLSTFRYDYCACCDASVKTEI